MNIFENISLALSSLKSNKMRALLTMLGIIIGIAAVIAIMTLGDSLTGSISGSLQSLGANNVTLSLQSKKTESEMAFGPASKIDDKHLMTDEMLEELRAEYPEDIEAYSLSESVGSGSTKKGRDYANLSLTGANEEYASANSLTITKGRFINDVDMEGNKKVAVVSDKLVSNMFGYSSPLGQQITLEAGTHTGTYTIIGVYEYENTGMGGMTSSEYDISTDVYIPLSTAQKINGSGGYQSITVLTSVNTDSTQFADDVTSFMNLYYSRNNEYGVSAFSMESMVESVNEILDSVKLAIAAIAGISLLVGGIGVMNIMLVSITERTKEIGTRKAIGAKNGEIRAQFIMESVIICLIGGLIGITLGILMGSAGASLLGTEASVSASVIALATGFAMLVGVFFGYYPANKAAKLDPIEALRYE